MRWAAALASDDLLRAAARSARRCAGERTALAAAAVCGAAAVLVAAVAPSTGGSVHRRHRCSSSPPRCGEQREITLADGTLLRLDTGSRCPTRYDADQRLVELRSGRAQFVVGKDPRPFLVKAGSGTVRDIGTTFQVSRIGEEVNVGLLEGRVDVTVDAGGAQRHSALVPGEQVTIDGERHDRHEAAARSGRAHAWPQGDLVFRQRRLDELVVGDEPLFAGAGAGWPTRRWARLTGQRRLPRRRPGSAGRGAGTGLVAAGAAQRSARDRPVAVRTDKCRSQLAGDHPMPTPVAIRPAPAMRAALHVPITLP